MARSFIKYLVADGRYDYIETGSLLCIRQNVKVIVIPSEEESFRLNPLDFEEFLGATGNVPLAALIRDSFEKQEALPEALHRKALKVNKHEICILFRELSGEKDRERNESLKPQHHETPRKKKEFNELQQLFFAFLIASGCAIFLHELWQRF